MPKRKANKVTKQVKSARGTKPNGKALEASSARRTKVAKRGAVRKKKADPVPARYGTATPHLIVSPCGEALEFYTKAFGAKVLMTMPGPDGRIMHAEMKIGDVDGFFEKAVGAGATSVMPPTDQFWGDRYGQIEDPFGHVWALATHLRDMTPREMKKAMAQMGAPEA
jgi:PhnB protein